MRRQFQAVFPVITGSFPTNVRAHLHGLSMDLRVGWTVGPTVDSTSRQSVELLDWQSNCVNNGLIVDPTIDPTVEITGYEAKCVQCTCFQWGSVPLRSDIKGTELPPANILNYSKGNWLRYNFRWQLLYNETLQQTSRPSLSKLSERRQI